MAGERFPGPVDLLETLELAATHTGTTAIGQAFFA
jgi:hypothetical protein